MTQIMSREIEEFLRSRCVSISVAEGLGWCGETYLEIPYLVKGKAVNYKRRYRGKRWEMKPGAPLTFWNVDCIQDAIAQGEPVVLCEGEIDAITAEAQGFCAVSVPNGAKSSLDFIGDIPNIGKVKRWILAVDADEPGQELKEELIQRLGANKCWVVDYGVGIKDLNELVMLGGEEAVEDCINSCEPVFSKGLSGFANVDGKPYKEIEYVPLGIEELDKFFQLWIGSTTVITGIPGHGKSHIVNYMLGQLIRLYGHSVALSSAEMPEYKLNEIFRRYAEAHEMPLGELSEHLFYINDSDEDYEFNVGYILSKAEILKIKHNIKWLVIDPWNSLEHKYTREINQVEQQRLDLKRLRKWGKENDVGVIILAHPTKDVRGKDGSLREPTPYDVDGSSHWFNNPDICITVYQVPGHATCNKIAVNKVKYHEQGFQTGSVWLQSYSNGLLRKIPPLDLDD